MNSDTPNLMTRSQLLSQIKYLEDRVITLEEELCNVSKLKEENKVLTQAVEKASLALEQANNHITLLNELTEFQNKEINFYRGQEKFIFTKEPSVTAKDYIKHKTYEMPNTYHEESYTNL